MIKELLFVSTLAVCQKPTLSLATSEFLPFENDQTELEPWDDFASTAVNFNQSFLFYGKKYHGLYVNSNGDVSFNRPYKMFWNLENHIKSSNAPIIAPFWADTDIYNGGTISYSETTDADINEKVTRIIQSSSTDFQDFNAAWTFIATWINVSFYGAEGEGRNRRNSFQVAISRDASGENSFAMFNYAKLEWSTAYLTGGSRYTGLRSGDSEDGRYKPALAGFAAGDGKTYNLPGSGTSSWRELSNSSNCGTPGRWVFKISQDIQAGELYTSSSAVS